jgi:hypothetical protein
MDGEAYLIMSSGKQLFPEDRLDAWYDGSAICVIAVGTHGDPLDLGEDEVRAFIEKLQACLKQVEGEDEGSPSSKTPSPASP